MRKTRSKRAASRHDADVLVVGAGAAGLAAASRLAAAGRGVNVLEARDRIGGRILTEHIDGCPTPIELGAEFLHGDAEPARGLAESYGMPAVDVAVRQAVSSRSGLAPIDDFMARVDRVLRRLDAERTADRSLAEMLRANRRSLSATDRAVATQYVEGYHAADAEDISERSLADQGSPVDDPRNMRTGRLLDGYGPLANALANSVRANIRLGVTVAVIRWRRGHVELECHDRAGGTLPSMTARAAIVTIPVGVLAAPPGAAGAIVFEPAIPALQQVVSVTASGSAVKLVLRFNDAFWNDERFAERLGFPDLDQVSFINSRRPLPFPVLWTTYPVRASLLTAWVGGPAAVSLSRLPIAGVESRAVKSLASVFRTTPAWIRARLLSTFHHDWINDPFARGVYSYARVGGHDAGARLGRPIQNTIWFAGEATAPEGRTGTVHGAIASGWRAADGIIGLSS
jgi:monoamine oxidase